MALCDAITGVPAVCDDNNLGSAKRFIIGEFDDVTSYTVSSTADPDTDGEITAITRETGTQFEEFAVKKDTSSFSENLVVDLVADTHSYNQTATIGLRRFSLRKRNALSLLAASRRNLVVIIEDNNGDYWAQGFTQGSRLATEEGTSNDSRGAGQSINFTVVSENETKKMFKVDPDIIIDGLLTAAV